MNAFVQSSSHNYDFPITDDDPLSFITVLLNDPETVEVAITHFHMKCVSGGLHYDVQVPNLTPQRFKQLAPAIIAISEPIPYEKGRFLFPTGERVSITEAKVSVNGMGWIHFRKPAKQQKTS